MNLSHVRALVARPEPQGKTLADAIRAVGGQALALPMLQIEALPETQTMRDCVLSLDQFDKVIVISRSGAKLGLELIEQYWPQLPLHCQWFAIGASTAQELESFNIKATFSEHGSDSEALLALSDLTNIAHQKILILKGAHGRRLLEDRLSEAGANVQVLSVYQRTRPRYEAAEVVKKLESHAINVILCGSGETLSNLGHYLPVSLRTDYQLLVPSERVARQALDMGFQKVFNACGASNDAMLQALTQL